MNKIISLTIGMLLLAGCAGVEQIDRIESKISAKEFNDLTSSYENRPTFMSVRKHSNGTESLTFEMDLYGSGVSTRDFDKTRISEYVATIDKYIEWEAKAVSKGDIFTKEIATIKAGGTQSDYKYKFVFHSGNAKKHYLTITVCTWIMCIPENDQVYDLSNAKMLKSTLLDYKEGLITVENISSQYQ